VPDFSAPFAAVLQQAMDREPDRRPSTAGELLNGLERALTSKENGGQPANRIRRALRRNKSEKN
jgi:hypothetical protein